MNKNKLFNALRDDARVFCLNDNICQNTKIAELYDEQHYLEFYDALYRKIQRLKTKRERKAYIAAMKIKFSEHETGGDLTVDEIAFTNTFTALVTMMISRTDIIKGVDRYVQILHYGMIIAFIAICFLQTIILKNKKRSLFYSRLLSDVEVAFDKR